VCTSATLLQLVDVLFDKAERYRRWAARWRQSSRRKDAEHQQWLNAVLAREVDKCVELLRVHISCTDQLVGRPPCQASSLSALKPWRTEPGHRWTGGLSKGSGRAAVHAAERWR
jgi:FCD domain